VRSQRLPARARIGGNRLDGWPRMPCPGAALLTPLNEDCRLLSSEGLAGSPGRKTMRAKAVVGPGTARVTPLPCPVRLWVTGCAIPSPHGDNGTGSEQQCRPTTNMAWYVQMNRIGSGPTVTGACGLEVAVR
jgi:hypothetical protein